MVNKLKIHLWWANLIWSLSRKKILGGVFIGMLVAFIPMPFQMVLVACLAILFNVNFSLLIFIKFNAFSLTSLYSSKE